MNCFTTYSIFMVTIFILSIRKLNAAPPPTPKIQEKIDDCVENIRKIFGDGNAHEHGSIAIEHFQYYHVSPNVWNPHTRVYDTDCCFDTISQNQDRGDIFNYYLSFKQHLHIGDIPEYLEFCNEFRLLIADTDNCVRILISVFGSDRDQLINNIFYNMHKSGFNPKIFTKTIYYVEPHSDSDSDDPSEDLNEGHIIDFNDDQFVDFTEIQFVDNEGVYVQKQRPTNIYYYDDDMEEPENTLNFPVLFLERVQQTFGINIDAMPTPRQCCEQLHNPSQ